MAADHHIGRYILGNDRAHGAKAMGADATELVDDGEGEAAEDGPILHLDMTGQRGPVGHDDGASDAAIVGNVAICHNPCHYPHLNTG